MQDKPQRDSQRSQVETKDLVTDDVFTKDLTFTGQLSVGGSIFEGSDSGTFITTVYDATVGSFQELVQGEVAAVFYGDVEQDDLGMYTESEGKFTAPVTGTYEITVTSLVKTGESEIDNVLFRHQVNVGNIVAVPDANTKNIFLIAERTLVLSNIVYCSLTSRQVVSLDVGDEFWVTMIAVGLPLQENAQMIGQWNNASVDGLIRGSTCTIKLLS